MRFLLAAILALASLPCAASGQRIAPGASAQTEAAAALAEAEAAVSEARRQQALWTTAEATLRAAREALARGDYRAAAMSARFASEQARLGIEQLNYPPVR